MAITSASRFRVGIDCHGTIFDTLSALQRYIRGKYRVSIPMESMSRAAIVGSYLSYEQYEQALYAVIVRHSYMNRHVHTRTGAIPVIRRLLEEGGEGSVEVISSSGAEAGNTLRNILLQREGLSGLSTRILPRHTLKGTLARDYDAVLEDNPTQALDLVKNRATNVFLITHPANASTRPHPSIERVSSFEEFYQRVSRIRPFNLRRQGRKSA